MTIRTYRSERVRVTGEHMGMLRQACYNRDGGRCRDCGQVVGFDLPDWHPQKYDMAHIRSRGAGGSDVLENVFTLCHRCHMREHSKGRSARAISALERLS